jgi:Permeases of the drug/metabolite transporter (DMT) superfamily
MDRKRISMLLGDLGILTVALIWGATNVVIRGALSGITPFWFCGLRFMLAFFTLLLLFGKRACAMPRKIRATGTAIGAIFVCAYLVGAVALLYTTAGNQSFIISMSVVFVPLCIWAYTRKFPGWHIAGAVVLCTAGMAGLMLDGNLNLNVGDALCFASMVFVSAHIMLVQRFVQGADPYGLACWQAFGGMLASLACALLFEPFPADISTPAWLAVVYAATIGFALTLVLQNTAQQHTTATHAAILLSLSGVFGSVIGVIFLGEPMTSRIFLSSATILAGVLLAEAIPSAGKRRNGGK